MATSKANIFRSKCIAKGKVCEVPVNGGSSKNIVFKVLVKVMQLPIMKHPNPYSIGWIKKKYETKIY